MPTVYVGDNTAGSPAMTYSGTEQARLEQGSPTTNSSDNGVNSEIAKYGAGDHKNWVLNFSGISNITGPVTVSSVILRLYKQSGSANTDTFSVYQLLVTPVEAEVTWNISSTGNNWNTGGGIGDGVDRVATPLCTFTSDAVAGYTASTDTAALRTFIEGVINGTITNTWMLIERTDGANDEHYKGFQGPAGDNDKTPYIEITYTEGGGGGGFIAALARNSNILIG